MRMRLERPSSRPPSARQSARIVSRHVRTRGSTTSRSESGTLLDDHLGDLIYALRKQGVKTSKTEIFELLLWELPISADGDLRRRIEQFRQLAPRV
jgi:hypothetical protein